MPIKACWGSLLASSVHHGGHGHVDGLLSIVGAYMTMLDAKFVVAALILNMFSTFIILSVINPVRPEAEPDIKLEKLHESQSFFEMLGEYILAGFKVAMIILAMLIGFIALISAVNALFSSVFGMSFQQIWAMCFIRWRGLSGFHSAMR